MILNCQPESTPVERAKVLFTQDLEVLETLVNGPLLTLAEHGSDEDSLRAAFYECRLAYKKIEHLTEYYFPVTSRILNGPPLPEYELDENKAFAPGGLQVVEEMLFPFEPGTRAELVKEVRKMQPELRRCRELWTVTEVTEAHLLDAIRLQLFRDITLGVSGFDTPICQKAIPELTTNLESLQRYVDLFAMEEGAGLDLLFEKAIVFTRKNPDFDTFDRLTFISDYINPLTGQLVDFQNALGFAPLKDLTPLRGDTRTLFDRNLFDPDFYTGDANAFTNESKVALGEKLFHEVRLSAGNVRSCASCHQPDKAFTDGLPQSVGLKGTAVARNAPTLFYAALQERHFYDQRASSLEAQSQDVIQNHDEMHGSLPEACAKLMKDSDYVLMFKKAFPSIDDIQPAHVMNALASYERTLLPFDSRFDRYMRGDKTVLNGAEKRGFNLFMGKAKCGTCHFMPIFNGTVPPTFVHSESEVLGVMTAPGSGKLDPDQGRGADYPAMPDLNRAFKIPTVRNVALTAPYMHNGAYQTLEQVIDFYDHGGAVGFGLNLPNQTLPADSLRLDAREKSDLVAFMEALTDLELRRNKIAQK
ncbi:cytochrome-c peroxidase [Persicitalea jodogahamensis]|uniref:Cytochrome-c peroxidase n=1 Tax=Persicitalea jodogahamensis TaxID=402147 RepID=A0A8J3DB95_9BACT|nr:cytochrome-c peroxidase [Persicitalea jodogahamensis]